MWNASIEGGSFTGCTYQLQTLIVACVSVKQKCSAVFSLSDVAPCGTCLPTELDVEYHIKLNFSFFPL